MPGSLRYYDHHQQVGLWHASITDTTPTIPTGWDEIDTLLRRGGLLPGTMTVLGGRTGTRKTTVMLNWIVGMIRGGHSVGLVGIDEASWLYTAKLASAAFHYDLETAEAVWLEDEGEQLRRDYKAMTAGLFHLWSGRRPRPDSLTRAMEMAGAGQSTAPEIVFIDYLALLAADEEYGYGDNSRIKRLAEDLAIWAGETNVALVVLHQLTRGDEFGQTNQRNQGQLPVTLTQLKYAGDEQADYVFGTYRPSKDPLGNMSLDVAKAELGDRFDEKEYWAHVELVRKYKHSTFVQLLKHRPGNEPPEEAIRGLEMLSPDASLFLGPKQRKVHEDMRLEDYEREEVEA